MGSDNVTHGSCFGDAEEPDQPEGSAVLAASSKRTDFVPGQRVDCGQGDDEPAECCGGLLKQAHMLWWPAADQLWCDLAQADDAELVPLQHHGQQPAQVGADHGVIAGWMRASSLTAHDGHPRALDPDRAGTGGTWCPG